MTIKENARQWLENYLKDKNGKLPIVDEIAVIHNSPLVISEITFVGLLCMAYDLRPQKNEPKEEPMNQQIEDKIVLRVLARFNERSQVGITKYNTTLERTDLSTLEWLTHAQEEAMDFVLYLERLKDEFSNRQLYMVDKDGNYHKLVYKSE
jgi:hypothetical protein